MPVRTVGVEEELFLVDPQTRLPAPAAPQVLRQADVEDPDRDPEDLGPELYRHQVETRTPPLRAMSEVRERLVAARALAVAAAEGVDLRVAASGTVPTAAPDFQVSPDDRYRAMVGLYGEIARPAGTCGMHVHVYVESPEVGVAVIDEIVPWLSVLLAIGANSPFHHGRDTGYASWRSQVWAQWPSAGPTETFGSLETYREVSRRLREVGAARDDGMLYFDARLAAEHPTVEVRVTDVCTDVDDAVLVAALVRGLVTRVADLAVAGRLEPVVDAPHRRAELLRAAQWRASRYGLSDWLLDPVDAVLAPARDVLDRLVGLTRDQLDEAGDVELVEEGIRRVVATGGASRQRAAFERSGSLDEVVDDLVERTRPADPA